jgi:hypothetical protein
LVFGELEPSARAISADTSLPNCVERNWSGRLQAEMQIAFGIDADARGVDGEVEDVAARVVSTDHPLAKRTRVRSAKLSNYPGVNMFTSAISSRGDTKQITGVPRLDCLRSC